MDTRGAAGDSLLGRGLERFPHAVLLTGSAGIGKTELAAQIVALLLCETPTPDLAACGGCPSCRWHAVGNHPDYRAVMPGGDADAEAAATELAAEKGKKRSAATIKIDQVRELEDFVFLGSHRHGRRVVLLTQAETMNHAAANALLKMLEEPPAGVFFILVTSKLRALLATLRSRCRIVTMAQPDREQAVAWLEKNGLGKEGQTWLDMAGGAPRQVAHWHEAGLLEPMKALVETLARPPTDPLVLATQWDGLLKGDGAFRLEHLVEGVQRWLFDQMQEAMCGRVRYHRQWQRPEREAASLSALSAGWSELLRFKRSARHPLNQLLFLEDMASHTLRALRPAKS
jgi:DNA polymerase-3 subunit delta'